MGGTDETQTFEEYSFKYDRLQQGPGVSLGADVDSETGLVLDYYFANVKDGRVYDASGNGYNGNISDAKIKEEAGDSVALSRTEIQRCKRSFDLWIIRTHARIQLRLAKEGNRDGEHIFLTDAMEDCQSMTKGTCRLIVLTLHRTLVPDSNRQTGADHNCRDAAGDEVVH